MIAPNRFQTEYKKISSAKSQNGVPHTRAIGSILDAVLAKYGIEVVDDIKIEMTDKNTTIISTTGISTSGIGSTSGMPQNYPLLISGSPEKAEPNTSRPKNEKKWQQRFLF